MPNSPLTISMQTQRRFILGKQGLFPGRRWQGKAGVAQAMREGVVVQFDPLNITARSYDIVLHSRVIDYSPDVLNEVVYQDREFFDHGGTVMFHPMESLPYWRIVMARNSARRAYLGEQNQPAVEEVLAALRERGPLSNRDFVSPPGEKKYWHASKTTAQAMYYLWLKGEVMTHSRKGVERRFDLAERIVPPQHNWTAGVEEAEAYFARQVFREHGLVTLRSWRGWWAGILERIVPMQEAAARLEAMEQARVITRVHLDGGGKDPVRYLLTDDLPLLEELHSGRIPAEWQPTGPTTEEEAVFLAPLDIVSARGRALPLFQFEYTWEVYKPAAERRWGYYVLPILYGDRLVARFDSRLDRAARTLHILGFWLEQGVSLDEPAARALRAGFERFARFAGADQLQWAEGIDPGVFSRAG